MRNQGRKKERKMHYEIMEALINAVQLTAASSSSFPGIYPGPSALNYSTAPMIDMGSSGHSVDKTCHQL